MLLQMLLCGSFGIRFETESDFMNESNQIQKPCVNYHTVYVLM